MPYSSTEIAMNDMEKLFELRARMLWSNPALAIVYGSYLEEALARPHKIANEGRIVLDNMRDIKSRTGLGRNTGKIANLTRELESLGLLKIISMTKDSQDSKFMVLTRPFLSELPQSCLSERDFLGATNKEATQPLLSEQSSSTPFFLSEVRLTQSVLKESILPMYLNSTLVSRDKDNSKVTNNTYFYSNTYSFLWGRNESTLGYQRLYLTQKVVLELICTLQFDVDSLARYLGVRKNNLKSRILEPLGEYVRIEDGIITPRENLLEVLERCFDRGRFDNIQRTKREGRSEYREQQREHMSKGDRKSMDLLYDFLERRKERKAARSAAQGAPYAPKEANHTGHGHHYGHESDKVTTERAIAAQDSLDLPDNSDVSESEEREAIEPEPEIEPEDQSGETYFDRLCEEIDALGFKGRGTGVTKDVALFLLENPETLRQEHIGSMWLGAKGADESMNVSPADFERALNALHHKTSFGAFADEQRNAPSRSLTETATPREGALAALAPPKATLRERLASEQRRSFCDKCDVRFSATDRNTTEYVLLCDECLVSCANGWH